MGSQEPFRIDGLIGPAWSSQRVALVSLAGCWTLYFVFVVFRLTANGFRHELMLLPWEALSALAGAVMTWFFYVLLRRLDRASILTRIGIALLMAAPSAVVLTIISHYLLFVLAPSRIWAPSFLRSATLRSVIASNLSERSFIFIAWSTLYISISSAIESQEARRRAAVLQAESRDAQLRALRYQLNPHFLFNALNTISALVLRGDSEGAESTIQALSLFLRAALVTETVEDSTLAEEIDLQQLYLEIEQVRFGDRLSVHLAIPNNLSSAMLPPLLLQPLVENVIRHAVAPTQERVTMTIAAYADHHSLHIAVEDDGRGGYAVAGTGIGLRNAASRLEARFGGNARFSHGPRTDGGYLVELTLPLVFKADHA